MSKLAANVATALNHPTIALEYLGRALQKSFGSGEPVRAIHGVKLGNFNGFSEYHSVRNGVLADELAFLSSYPFGDGTIIDVGANLGLFSLLVNQRYRDRSIIAFEPNPSTFAALLSNVARNEATGISCHQVGIAAHDGFVSFAAREHARANASIRSETTMSQGDEVQVACTTLDTFCRSNTIDRIALLKVDVEGYETLVFRGAEKILTDVRPGVIYFEVCPSLTLCAGYDPSEPARHLLALGYDLFRLAADGQLSPVDANACAAVRCVENWVGIDKR